MNLKVVFNKPENLALLVTGLSLLISVPAAADPDSPPGGGASPTEVVPPPAPPDPSAPAPTPPDPAAAPPGNTAAPPPVGPTVDMPPDATTAEPAPTAPAIDDRDLVRGLRERRFEEASAGATVLGGYGELHYNLELPENGESEAELDLHRFVLFLAHKFDEHFRLYAEIEIEHAFASAEMPGEVEMEQAFVDWQPWGEALGLRAGVVLVPMGIINQWHEPPVFHGVERPRVDRVIIPTTWREGGVGIFGEPVEGLRYELYLVGGLNPLRFNARNGIREGRQSVAEGVANGPAVTGRIEWEPALGLLLGGSAYFGAAGPNAGELNRLVGRDLVTGAPILERLDIGVPVLGLSADVRLRMHGLEARAAFATFSVGNTAALRQAVDDAGDSLGIDVGSRSIGAYAEVAYDVLRLVTQTDMQLLPFVRFEYYDTMASITGRSRAPADDAFRGTDLAFGLSYRPITQVVIKGDFIYRNPGGAGSAERLVDFGVGWMF